MTAAALHKLVETYQLDILKTIELSEDLLASLDSNGQTAISKIIIKKGLEFVPQELLTEQLLFTASKPEEEGADTTWSTLDCAIRADQYHLLPDKLRNKQVLLKGQAGGWTGLHLAAAYGKLPQLDQGMLTIKNLCIPNDIGANCYHFAALNGFIRQIPIDCLTPELLLIPDEEKVTPLEYVRDVNEDDLYYLPVDESCREILGDKLDDILAARRQKEALGKDSDSQHIELF